jgi:hypothetical protein
MAKGRGMSDNKRIRLERDGKTIWLTLDEAEVLAAAAHKHGAKRDPELFGAIAAVKAVFPESRIVGFNVDQE